MTTSPRTKIRGRPKERMAEKVMMPDVVPDLENAEIDSIKCVVVGDGAIGKTSLIVSYTVNGYPEVYKPTVHDYYTVRITVAEKPITFQLFDTAGQEQFNVIRRLSYSHASIFLVCFNVVDPESFENIREKWIPELREHAPYGVPIILVGLQSDQRNIVDVKCKLGSRGKRPIKYEEGESLAKKIGARKYVECSSLTQKHLKSVFDYAIITAIEEQSKKTRKPSSFRRNLQRLSSRRDKKSISRTISSSSESSSLSNSFSFRDLLCLN